MLVKLVFGIEMEVVDALDEWNLGERIPLAISQEDYI